MSSQTNKLSLYNIGEEVHALDRLSEELGGEITPELEQLQEECTALIKDKVDSYVAFTEMLNDDIALAKDRIKKLNAFIKTRENKIENMKQFAFMALDKCGQKEFKGSLASIKERKAADVLDLVDADQVPVEFLKHIPASTTVDKAALKKAIKNGEYSGEAARLVAGKRSINFSFKSC